MNRDTEEVYLIQVIREYTRHSQQDVGEDKRLQRGGLAVELDNLTVGMYVSIKEI